MNKTHNRARSEGAGSERVICGLHACESYIDTGEVTRLFVTSELRHPLIKAAKAAGVPISNLKKSELDLYSNGENHQGVVAFVKGYPYLALPELLDELSGVTDPLVLFLDRLTDPHNLGAIARSAYLLGAHAICIPLRGSASVTQGAVKSSVGATGHIRICRVVNMGKALDLFKQEGYRSAGLVMGAAQQVAEADLTGPMVLVVGSEDRGIRPTLEKRLDYTLGIPMAGQQIGSFNASVAASIVLYEAFRQRSG